MYIGRIIAAGLDRAGAPALMYRISSRSYPNRRILLRSDGAEVASSTTESEASGYIYYDCARVSERYCIVSNGSQTPWIADKLERGMNPRDALAAALMLTDYERDELDTPRIAAVAMAGEAAVHFGSVARRDLCIWSPRLAAGEASFLATYENMHLPDPARRFQLPDLTAPSAAHLVMDGGPFAAMTGAVCALGAVVGRGGWDLAAV
jgi:IMP cyclohydrolase